jgi:hypothetical protein
MKAVSSTKLDLYIWLLTSTIAIFLYFSGVHLPVKMIVSPLLNWYGSW